MNTSSLNDPQSHNTQQSLEQEHIDQEQQVLLFWLLSKILRRLARRIAWADLSAHDRRRLKATLKTLENDVQLVHTVISARPTHPKDFARTAKKANGTDN